jgi:hypothetical protein
MTPAETDVTAATDVTSTAAPPARPAGGHRFRRRLPWLLFPGDARVWRWSLVAVVPMLAGIGYALIQPRTYYTATHSV